METELFNTFKARRDLWVKCFSLEDRNSIISQAYDMVWKAAVFKMINLSRKLAIDKGKNLNGMLHEFIDDCFFQSQFLAIRRLIDVFPLEGTRGVFSLRPLLEDMKGNTGLMRREFFFAVDGLDYNYKSVEERADKYRFEQLQNGKRVFGLPRDLDTSPIVYRHEKIDVLSGVSANNRATNDAVRNEIFDFLIKRIESSTEHIGNYVTKNIAHAATPESRTYDKFNEVAITLNHLWEAHKSICQIISFVNTNILFKGNGGFLPVPQFDQFQSIDQPLITKDDIDILSDEWRKFDKEAHSWAQWGAQELEMEMAGNLSQPQP